jgi:serine/threonine protein kinase
LIGRSEHSKTVNIIDFGLAKQYRDASTYLHIPEREGCTFTGTTSYASINNHMHLEQSRRDDLESLAYIFIYFLRGSLPWQDVKHGSQQPKQRTPTDIKKNIPVGVLCEGCPPEIGRFLEYARALRFEEKPDYAYLRKLFHDLFIRQGYGDNNEFDWCKLVTSVDDQSVGNISKSANQRRSTKKRSVLVSDRV